MQILLNTDKLLDQSDFLPMHTELEEEQLKFITDSVLEFMKISLIKF